MNGPAASRAGWCLRHTLPFKFLLGVCLAMGSVSAQADHAGDLRPRLQQLASRHGICAATFALIRHRELISVDTGQGCGAERALSADAVFQAASLSKPVFAYAVLTLVRQGRLGLDDPISMHLPDGAVHRAAPHRSTGGTDHVPAWRLSGITVRMALNHTSGLPNWAGGPLVFDTEPGGEWRYSGEAYVLLQQVVESVTRQRLDKLMQQLVFTPLGMKHSSYVSTPALNGLRVDGALADGTILPPLKFEQAVSAFSLQTTARDYGAFVAALLKDDGVLQQIVERPVPMAPDLGVRWGLGWGLAQGPTGDLLWHWGNNPGYRSFVMASPASGDALVLFAAQDGGLVLARPLAEAVFPGPHPLFRLPLLRDGLDSLLCEVVDLCS